MTIKIKDFLYSGLEKEINKLNRSAEKLGCQAITIKILSSKQEEHVSDYGFNRFYTILEVEVEGLSPKLEGWELISKVERNGDSTVVYNVPDKETPQRYRNTKAVCDHCETKRYRKHTFIVYNSDADEYAQVGRTCIKDFLGHKSPTALASYFERLSKMNETLTAMEDYDECYGGGDNTPRSIPMYNLVQVLTHSACQIRLHGFVSKAYASEGNESTAYNVESNINIVNHSALSFEGIEEVRAKIEAELTEDDELTADKAIAWIKAKGNNNQDLGDYLENLYQISKEDHFPTKQIGYVASMIQAYLKDTGQTTNQKVARVGAGSQYIGAIGDKINESLKLIKKLEKESYSAFNDTFYIYTFVDENENVYVWLTGVNKDIEIDETVEVSGRIKDHKEFAGIKQNSLTRCRIK